MFLSIDVGNTQAALGLYDDEGAMVQGWRMPTNPTDTSDTLEARLFAYCLKDGVDLASITDAGLACVVPVLTRAWSKCLAKLTGRAPVVVTSGHTCGMQIDMPYPTTVGADRIANAVEARERYGCPVIVVDFGTATNIDVVDARGAYRGGTISPGLMLSAGALFGKAAKLSNVPVVAPEVTCGRTTEEAVQAGLVVGAAAMAEGLVARIKSELGINEAQVIGTGGLARTVGEATDLFDAIDSDLTLRGIRRIWLAQRAEGE